MVASEVQVDPVRFRLAGPWWPVLTGRARPLQALQKAKNEDRDRRAELRRQRAAEEKEQEKEQSRALDKLKQQVCAGQMLKTSPVPIALQYGVRRI